MTCKRWCDLHDEEDDCEPLTRYIVGVLVAALLTAALAVWTGAVGP